MSTLTLYWHFVLQGMQFSRVRAIVSLITAGKMHSASLVNSTGPEQRDLGGPWAPNRNQRKYGPCGSTLSAEQFKWLLVVWWPGM